MMYLYGFLGGFIIGAVTWTRYVHPFVSAQWIAIKAKLHL